MRTSHSIQLVALFAALSCSGQLFMRAEAQSYSYWPWAIGSSLIYPLRYLGYSAYGNSGYNNPGWVGGSILQRATRGTGGMGYGGYSPTGNPNFANVNNNAQGNVIQQPNVVKYGSYPYGNQNPDGSALNPQGATTGNTFNAGTANQNGNTIGSMNSAGNYSNSNYPAAGVGAPAYQGAQSTPVQPNQPGQMPGQMPMNQANNNFANDQMHHGRTKNKVKNKKNSTPGNLNASGSNAGTANAPTLSQNQMQPISTGVSSTAAAPFAVAFINNVNSEYHGDIRKALSNSQTRAWAQSLGINYKENSSFAISDERSGLIEHVLKDSALDPVSKLDTIKILLRN